MSELPRAETAPLRPCPYCGGEAHVHDMCGHESICHKCGAQGPMRIDGVDIFTAEDVTDAWNMVPNAELTS